MNNKMREVLIDKIVVHSCAGESGNRLENVKSVLFKLTGKKPVETKAKKRLPKWGIRPGLSIGAKVTLRKKDAEAFLKKVFSSLKNKLPAKSIDANGNFAIGVAEYIDIKGMKYDPSLGLLGFDVIVNLKRRGYRVKNKAMRKSKVGKKHIVRKEDAINFLKEKFGVELI